MQGCEIANDSILHKEPPHRAGFPERRRSSLRRRLLVGGAADARIKKIGIRGRVQRKEKCNVTVPRDTKRVIELQQHLHSHIPSRPALRVRALESLLVEKGLLNSATVDRWIEVFSEEVGPKNGARVVARASTDPDFKQRLLTNGTEAIAELNCPRLEATNLTVVENARYRHNVVVCTLCSCYPWGVLGIPPTWYKSFEYPARGPRTTHCAE
jgi:hypothetical protein